MPEAVPIDPERDILGLIDVQPTFMPGGALAVADGDAVVPVINRLLAGPFAHAFATQDWHPPGHLSFASGHSGKAPFETIKVPYGEQTLWPDHALQGSAAAELHPALRADKIEVIVRKGFRKSVDSYSAFFENDHATTTGLDGYLKARGFRRVFLAGLATDFCVGWSAEDAAGLGYSVFVVEDACRGIGLPLTRGRTSIDATRERLSVKGIGFIRSSALLES